MIKITKIDYVGSVPVAHLFSDDETDILPIKKFGVIPITHGADCIQKSPSGKTKVFMYSETHEQWIEL